MKKLIIGFLLSLWRALLMPLFAAAETNPAALTALLNRIGGEGTADRFTVVVDDALSTDGKDVFVLSADGSKPKISGSSALAAATGINWYLNHYAHVNLAWNQLTADLTTISLPTPTTDETRTCEADYRYYLNYCTFSYSMCTWTWERWQQEIDWMALHGINMPLQIVGLDVLWYNLLTKDLGYSKDEANEFIAGPSFQAWWGMNNLEGWGGPNRDWWYERQEQLCKDILSRMRELDMDPVLPGYAGMVPHDYGQGAINQGEWCAFTRPYILNPNSDVFADVATKYYTRLAELMGTSDYYSIDPFHEGANTDGIDVPAAYEKLYEAMKAGTPENSKWVIQFWQWSGAQYNVLDKVDNGRLIILDLFSDNQPAFGSYKGHDAVWCSLANFGGRTGLFGRFNKVIDRYYADKAAYSHIKGIGATPEAIEQVPVLYDALFELPWRPTKPDAAEWMADYTVSRYGVENDNAKAAWEKLRTSALNCTSGLQGPHEAMLCARPALSVGSVSAWGGTTIFYDIQDMVTAAHLLKDAGLSGENYSYDLTDVTRQALTDYASQLLATVKATHDAGKTTEFEAAKTAYLTLFDDLETLLNTNHMFRLGHWTETARAIADEVAGTTAEDKNWLELDNARRLITTWGAEDQANTGGLRDYSYREWGGMMADFYKPRWEAFFNNGCAAPAGGWFAMEDAWVKDGSKSYTAAPDATVTTLSVAGPLLTKYFLPLTKGDASTHYIYRYCQQDLRGKLAFEAFRGQSLALALALPTEGTATLSVDTDNNGVFGEDESTTGLSHAIPETAVTGNMKAQVALTDGTVMQFNVVLKDDITAERTVTVAAADANGTVAIVGAEGTSVTNTSEVQLKATPVSGYDFEKWTDAAGNLVSRENPYTYYGKDAATFTAHFIINKWGVPEMNTTEVSTIEDFEQYLTTITMARNDGEPVSIYSTSEYPGTLFQTTSVVEAPKGGQLTLAWKDTDNKDGLGYCRLSAYIDLNSDGDFDDEGEFIAVVGNKNTSGGNTMLSDGSLDVLLPYEMPLGITHVRLRFDSSWLIDLNANDAIPAKAETKRMVYDIPVNVTAYSATACEITAATSNAKYGEVDTNGNTNPYTWSDPTEDVKLRAYPNTEDGFELKGWTDQYGRYLPASWMDGNTLTFKPAESGTFTAQFKHGKWNIPEENTDELTTLNQYKQYITSLSVTQNEGAEVLYTNSSAVENLYHVTGGINVPQGSKFTLTWGSDGDGLNYTRLSAYIDLNSDGDFEDEGELLGVRGSIGSTDAVMSSNKNLEILLPYDIPLGASRVRLRFDGAWNEPLVEKTDAQGNTVKAMPADAKTVRMVYDVPLNILAKSATDCTITVDGGSITGQDNPYTWTGNSETAVTLVANADGGNFVHWTDPHDRVVPADWGTGSTITFFPRESGTYTAHFIPAEFTFDGWTVKFTLDKATDELTLTEVVSGSGAMNIPATWTYDDYTYTIKALAPGFLKGCTGITSLTIPETVTNLGEKTVEKLNELTWISGDAAESNYETLTTSMSATEDWTFVGHFMAGDASYNEWGSALVAAGDDPIWGGNYDNRFQLYYSASKKLSVKVDGTNQSFTLQPGSEFDVQMKYDASEKKMFVTLINSEGKMELKEYAAANFVTIEKLSYALGAGMTADVYFEKPVETSYTGDIAGTEGNEAVKNVIKASLPFTLEAGKDWTFQAHVTNNGNSANAWGSGLLASGEAPTADSYLNGFQFYLAKSGELKLKLFSEYDNGTTDFGNVGASFDIEMVNADGMVTVTVTRADGTVGTHSATNTGDWSISKVSSLIPEGIHITYTITPQVDKLFEGCTALTSIAVDANNAKYASEGGVLYDKEKETLLRAPEALPTTVLTLPATVKRVAEFSLSHVTGLQRVDATAATMLHDIPLAAFEGITIPLQVSPGQCSTYGRNWHEQLLVQAVAGEPVNAADCANADILEVCASDGASGAFTADNATAERWLTYTFEPGKPVALCFPTELNRVSTGLSLFDVYEYVDGKFQQKESPATPLAAGSYVWTFNGDVATTATFEMAAGAGAVAVATEGFGGNGTMTEATAENALFLGEKYFSKTGETAVAPYVAYLVDAAAERLPFLTPEVTFDENSEEEPSFIPSDDYANVKMTRKLNAGKWNTLCLPFDLDAAQTAALFEDVEVLGSYTDGVLNFKKEETIRAGVPYIVWPKADATALTLDNVYFPVASGLQDVNQTDVIMKGNWHKMRLENHEYFISNNAFYYATATNWASLKAFRAYIELAKTSEVRTLSICVDGVLTGVESVDAEGIQLAPVSVYDLRGILLRKDVPAHKALEGLPSGTYVVNGKKITIR